MDTAVQPEPPSGLLRCAASPASRDPAAAPFARDALVHPIDALVADLVIVLEGEKALHPRLHTARVEQRVLRHARIARKDEPPQARRSHVGHLEYRGPFHRIGDIGVHRKAVPREVVRRADDEELLGPGEAFELHREQLPDRAAAAVCADQPRGFQLARIPSDSNSDQHRIRLLLEAGDSVPEMHFAVGSLRRMSSWMGVRAVLLEMQAIRVGRLVGKQPQVELRDQASRGGCRISQRRTCSPCSCMRSVMPYGAIISCVGGWKVPARRSCVRLGSASHTTRTPRRASASAHISPVGTGARDHHGKFPDIATILETPRENLPAG